MQNPMFNDPHPDTGWEPPGFDPRIGESKFPTWRAENYKLAVFPYEGLYRLWPNGHIRNQKDLTPAEKADFDDGWIAVCLAVLRRDGFVSLTAGDKAGQLITKPCVATGSQLLLNADVHEAGEARMEVLGEDKKAIHGFELSSSVPLRGKEINQFVRWRDKADWARLAGKTVSLRIQLRNADLYALCTEKE
jgi:hypothetical protein